MTKKGSRRAYWDTILKWAARAGVPTTIGLAVIFLYLSNTEAIEVTGYSGNQYCRGTLSDPCEIYLNFSVKTDVFIYPNSELLSFDEAISNQKLYRKWGTGWREIDLTKPCNSTTCGASTKDTPSYAWALRKGNNYEIKMVVFKNYAWEDIYWSMSLGGIK